MFDLLVDATVFSKLEIKTGFHQIKLKPEDIEKTALNTKCGTFEYLVRPMGLLHVPVTFQLLMNRIFHDCIYDFQVVDRYDLLVFCNSETEHLKTLNKILSCLSEHNLFVLPKKCDFIKQ